MSADRLNTSRGRAARFSIASLSPVMRMTWRHLLFIHWPVPVATLRAIVPEAFKIDALDGRAWVGLIPFTMTDVTVCGLPRVPWRGVTDFHECNVRTYVRRADEPGVYFFSLDAASRLAVWGARRYFHLAYQIARMTMDVRGDEIDYFADRVDEPRASMRCRWRVGARPASARGELAHFLTERYQLFTTDRGGRPYRCRIAHEPWRLREAELLTLDDGLVRAAGIKPPDGAPTVFAADRMCVRAYWPERC